VVRGPACATWCDNVHIGQAEIEDDEVRLTGFGGLESLLTGDCLDEGVTMPEQRDPKEASDLWFVFDQDDDRFLGRGSSAGGGQRLRVGVVLIISGYGLDDGLGRSSAL
jgi:hypothetical protein